MEITLITIFALGYLAITLEHSLKIDKLIPALAMMSILWALISVFHLPVFEVDTLLKELKPGHVDEILLHHLGKTAEIIIFLLGAMTIVEIIDYFNGFATIKGFIRTNVKVKLETSLRETCREVFASFCKFLQSFGTCWKLFG